MSGVYTILKPDQDRIELLDAILKPSSSRIPPSALIRQPNDSDSMLMINPTLSADGDTPVAVASTAAFEGPLSPTHKDFILVAQIIAEQIIFSSLGMASCFPKILLLIDAPDYLPQPLTTEDEFHADTVPKKSNTITPIHAVQTALKSFHSGLTECDLFKFLCISDHEKPQGAKGQPQPQAKKVNLPGSEFSIAHSMSFSSPTTTALTYCSDTTCCPTATSRSCSPK